MSNGAPQLRALFLCPEQASPPASASTSPPASAWDERELMAQHHNSTERDACGIGFVADGRGRASRALLDETLDALCRVRHRGAVAADALTGDGAGVLLPLPHAILSAELTEGLPQGHDLGVAMAFLDPDDPGPGRAAIESAGAAEATKVLGWRRVPVDHAALGDRAPIVGPSYRAGAPGAPRRRRQGQRASRVPDEAAHRADGAGRVGPALHPVALLQNRHLQGSVCSRPARSVLSGSDRLPLRGLVRHLSPALLDEHHADLGAGATLPLPRPQRRDQHDQGQHGAPARTRGSLRRSRSHP